MISESRRRFPVALVILPLGALCFLVGILLLALERGAPDLLRQLPPQAHLTVPAILIGGALLTVGLGAIVVGWGDGGSRRPLPYGSHRSIVATTLLTVLVAAVITVLYLALLPGANPQSSESFACIAVIFTAALLAMTYLQGVRRGLVTSRSLGLSGEHLRRGLRWGLLGAGVLLAVAVVNQVVLSAFGIEQPQRQSLLWLRELPAQQYLLVAAAVAVVAPVGEELFFRGYVFNAYLAEKGERTAYVASSLIFGVVHGQVALLLAIFCIGLVQAYLYRRTGTILAPIVSHVLNNSIAFASLFAMPSR